MGCREERGIDTSVATVLMASQSRRGRMFCTKAGLYSTSRCSSSASWKWRGKDLGEVLQALTAQVRKLTVKSFISCCKVGAVCSERVEVYAERTRDLK